MKVYWLSMTLLSVIFLSIPKYQAHRCPAADLKYKDLWLDDITGTRDNLRDTC